MTRKHCKNCKNPIKGHNGPAGNRCTNAPASDTPAKKGKGRHQSPPPTSEGVGDTSTVPGEPVTSQPAGGGKLPDMPSGDVPDVNVSCPTTSSGVGNPSLDASLAVGHVSPANVSVQAPVVSVPSVWSVPDGSGRPGVLSYPYSAWGTAALPPLDVTRSARQHTTPASDSGLTTAQNGLLPIYTRPAGPQNGIIPGCDNYGENMAPVSTHSEGAAGGGVNAHIPVSAHSEGAAGGVNVGTTPQGGYHGYPGGSMFAMGGANMPYGFTHPFHNNLNGLYNQLPYAGYVRPGVPVFGNQPGLHNSAGSAFHVNSSYPQRHIAPGGGMAYAGSNEWTGIPPHVAQPRAPVYQHGTQTQVPGCSHKNN